MGVIGAPGSTIAEFLGHTLAGDRVVLVAPGIQNPDGTYTRQQISCNGALNVICPGNINPNAQAMLAEWPDPNT